MPYPFPGMDPWLEHPALWPDVRNSLIAALRDHLGPRLRPRYVVRLEERTYLSEPEGMAFVGRPDLVARGDTAPSASGQPRTTDAGGVVAVEIPLPDQIRETWLELRVAASGEVVTVLELLSPSNKAPGEGRRLYGHKRSVVLGSSTHLVEVDLCRAGTPPPFRGAAAIGDYRVLTSRSPTRPRAELRPFTVREPIPRFPLPLRAGDDEPEIDLGGLLAALYDRASYDLSAGYASPPTPPLQPDDAAWAEALLRRAGALV